MAEKKLDFNKLEARGLFMAQQNVLELSRRAAQAQMELMAVEADAAELVAGRVPAGVTIRQLRIDQASGAVFAPEPEPAPAPPAPAPAAAPAG